MTKLCIDPYTSHSMLLSFIAGALLPLAFAPFNLYWLAVIAPTMASLLWSQATPRRCLRLGYAFGLGMFGVGVSWVFVSIHEFGGVDLIMSIFLTALFIGFLSLFPALLAYVLARFVKGDTLWRRQLAWLFAFPAAWVLFEWVRGWFLTGFPWLLLGYSQIDTPLAGLGPLLGVYGISLATAISAALLLMMFRRPYALGSTTLALALLVSLWLGAAWLKTIEWTEPEGKPLQVTLLQGNVPQDMKWLWESRAPTIELYTKLTREHWGSDLIVWPESALPSFYDEAREFLAELGQEARANHTDLLIGLLYQDPETQRYYNSMVSAGSAELMYHKRHLVPFTEYLPLQGILGGLVEFMHVPMSNFSAGRNDQAPMPLAGQRVGISICYEDAFGEEIIRDLPAATLLVNVSNDAWFGESIAPFQHMQIARMRALETGRPLLRATNTGITGIVDARGKLQSSAPQFEVYALSGAVQAMRGMTPYARMGNAPVVIICLLMLIIAYLIARPRRL